jgi:hypothetical protein
MDSVFDFSNPRATFSFLLSPNVWTRFSVTVSIMPRDHATHTHAHTPTRLPTHTSPLPFDFLFGFVISILFFISFSFHSRFFVSSSPPGGTECGLVAVSTSATPRTVVIEGESMTSDQVLRVVDALVKWLAANNYKVCENVLYSPLRLCDLLCLGCLGWLVGSALRVWCVRGCVRAVRCGVMRAWTPLLHLGLVPPTHTADSVWSCCRSSRVVSSASSTPSVVTRSLRECARAPCAASLYPITTAWCPLFLLRPWLCWVGMGWPRRVLPPRVLSSRRLVLCLGFVWVTTLTVRTRSRRVCVLCCAVCVCVRAR